MTKKVKKREKSKNWVKRGRNRGGDIESRRRRGGGITRRLRGRRKRSRREEKKN